LTSPLNDTARKVHRGSEHDRTGWLAYLFEEIGALRNSLRMVAPPFLTSNRATRANEPIDFKTARTGFNDSWII